MFCSRQPENVRDALRDRMRSVWQSDASLFEKHRTHGITATVTLSADGFTIPTFEKTLQSYVQANAQLLMEGAPSSGRLSSHMPLVLGRCKESYEAYQTIWPEVEAPFLTPEGGPLQSIQVSMPPVCDTMQPRYGAWLSVERALVTACRCHSASRSSRSTCSTG